MSANWWRDNNRPLSRAGTIAAVLIGYVFVTLILIATFAPVALWLRGEP